MGRSFGKVFGLVAALALSAVVVVGCGDDNDDGGGSFGGDGSLVGDWLYDNNYGDDKYGISVKSSGQFVEFGFRKIYNFYIEMTSDEGLVWRTENGQIIVYHPSYPQYAEVVPYTVVGNTLTAFFTYCDEEWVNGRYVEVCDEEVETFTRTNISTLRSQLGTVRTQDPALHSQAGINDLAWYLVEDDDYVLDFDGGSLYEGDYYFYYYHSEKTWYTSGNRLFLLGLDEDCSYYGCTYAVAEEIELQYSISGSGASRRLTTREVFPDGSLDYPAVWAPYDLSDDYYWSPAKTKAGSAKRPGKLFKSPRAKAKQIIAAQE